MTRKLGTRRIVLERPCKCRVCGSLLGVTHAGRRNCSACQERSRRVWKSSTRAEPMHSCPRCGGLAQGAHGLCGECVLDDRDVLAWTARGVA